MAKKDEMEMFTATFKTLPEAWFFCIDEAYRNGYEYKIDHGSYAGSTRQELDFIAAQIEYPGTRPLIPDVPPGYGLPPPTTMEYVESYFNRYLMTSLTEGNEQYTYGQDLEKQIPKVIEMYLNHGFETNQACMSVGSTDSINLADPQCLRVVDTRIRYGKLHFIIYFRSWDLWSGFPANLAGLQLVKEYMLEHINAGLPLEKKLKDGCMIIISKGLHLYGYAKELAEIRLGKNKK